MKRLTKNDERASSFFVIFFVFETKKITILFEFIMLYFLQDE